MGCATSCPERDSRYSSPSDAGAPSTKAQRRSTERARDQGGAGGAAYRAAEASPPQGSLAAAPGSPRSFIRGMDMFAELPRMAMLPDAAAMATSFVSTQGPPAPGNETAPPSASVSKRCTDGSDMPLWSDGAASLVGQRSSIAAGSVSENAPRTARVSGTGTVVLQIDSALSGRTCDSRKSEPEAAKVDVCGDCERPLGETAFCHASGKRHPCLICGLATLTCSDGKPHKNF